MVWDWNNPIGLGLFFLMCAGAVMLLGAAVWLLTRAGLPWADHLARRSNRR